MRWNYHPDDEAETRALADKLNVHPLTIRVMHNRGLRTQEDMRRFLASDYRYLSDPFLFKDIDKAVERVRSALLKRQRIHIHGDYDVDGLSATSVLYLGLKYLGADVHYYVAHRKDSEVGLSDTALERDHYPRDPDLIITADCGSTSVENIARSQDRGIDVIVVDHHQLGDDRPPCVALLNPHQPGCNYPFKELAAVGVAYHFLRGLDRYLQSDHEYRWPALPLEDYLDLVALGTVADVVPILEDNRIFVREGLRQISSAKRPGICALMSHAHILREDASGRISRVTARTIGYRIAPLINAAGRMGDANRCVELLTTDTYRVAVKIGEELVLLNQQRQHCEREILKEAQELADLACEQGDEVIVLAQPHWHPGVLGIVASRLMERTNRPTIIASINSEGIARGSVRSPERVNMLEALNACSSFLEAWGGHPRAAGLQTYADRWDEFRRAINHVVREDLPIDGRPAPRITVDATIDLDSLDDSLLEQIALLAPFGTGNPEPVLRAHNVQPMKAHIQNGRLRVRFRQGAYTAHATGYGLSDVLSLLQNNVDILFSPHIPRRAGARFMSVTLHDVRATNS